MMYSSEHKPPHLRQFTLKVGWRSATAPADTAANIPAQPAPPACAPAAPDIETHLAVPISATHKQKSPPPNWFLSCMVTAIIVIAVLAIAPRLFPTPAPSAVATIAQAQGDFYRNKHPSHTAATLYQGDTLATDKDSQVRIKLHNALQLTLDANTTLTLNDQSIFIHTGRAYIDATEPNTGITVATPFAEITDIGTQYEVHVTQDALQLTMRDGTTKITSPYSVLYASTSGGLGDVITLDNAGNSQTTHIAKSDEHWQWALNTTPSFNLYNASLEELLQWTSRTTGKEILYASEQIQQQAKNVYFSGGNLNSKTISQDIAQALKNMPLKVTEHRRAFMVETR